MNEREKLVAELAEKTGSPLKLNEQDALELDVGGESILAHYEDENADWVISGIVLTADAADATFPRATLERALSANLLGVGTKRLHLGLFADSLVLAGRYPAADLTADDLGRAILFVAQTLPEVRERISGASAEGSDAAATRVPQEATPFAIRV